LNRSYVSNNSGVAPPAISAGTLLSLFHFWRGLTAFHSILTLSMTTKPAGIYWNYSYNVIHTILCRPSLNIAMPAYRGVSWRYQWQTYITCICHLQ